MADEPREARCRRLAAKRGLRLEKNRNRDPNHPYFGGFAVYNERNICVHGIGPLGIYAADLDDVEAYLSGEEKSRVGSADQYIYAAVYPRGSDTESEVHIFETKEARETWIADAGDEHGTRKAITVFRAMELFGHITPVEHLTRYKPVSRWRITRPQ